MPVEDLDKDDGMITLIRELGKVFYGRRDSHYYIQQSYFCRHEIRGQTRKVDKKAGAINMCPDDVCIDHRMEP